jgi:hypothetical protein
MEELNLSLENVKEEFIYKLNEIIREKSDNSMNARS